MTAKKSPLRVAINRRKITKSKMSDADVFALTDFEPVKLSPLTVKGAVRKALRNLKNEMPGATEAGIIRSILIRGLKDRDVLDQEYEA
jgi:hypothetical protein